MTTPTGQIKMSDVRLEIYGSASGQIDMNDINVSQLAGVANSAQTSMSQLKGKTWNPIFSTPSGTYSNNSTDTTCTWTFTSSNYVTWSFVKTYGVAGNANIANNSVSNTITFSVGPGLNGHTTTWNVTGVVGKVTITYTITLNAASSSSPGSPPYP